MNQFEQVYSSQANSFSHFLFVLCFWSCFLWHPEQAYTQSTSFPINIPHYQAHIEPDIKNQTIQGKVKVQFTGETDLTSSLSLDCGDLTIDSVIHANTRRAFVQIDHQVHIDISNLDTTSNQEVSIHYHGKPRYGIQFFPEVKQVYTVFSTSQWMPCRDAIDERATFELNLILPATLMGIGNGELIAKEKLPGDKVQYTWKSAVAVPSYIFGFAAGPFNSYEEQYQDTKLHYLSSDYSEEELQQIFVETPNMLQFFEDKAGIPYPGKSYIQILPKGKVSQEMTNFTVMRNKYGEQVLERPMDINLAAHELAHQWWGNQVTCHNWNHFWLNEGMAVFMSSAYKEHRFGRGVYLEDIEVYRKAYQAVVDKGMDRPLVFPNWNRPTTDDRTLVYYKGAYFIHLLREEVGEAVFWEAIRVYTKAHFGQSVVSKDLQVAMEAASGRDLSSLFEKWMY